MVNKIGIGSEFNLNLNSLHIVEDNLYAYFKDHHYSLLDFCRSAIRCIPINKQKKVLLPEYICASVINCFEKDKIKFYKIDNQFNIDLENLTAQLSDDIGCIYVAHYFGFLQNDISLKYLKEYANEHNIILIEDKTQSLFTNSMIYGDFCVASIRKWMPIPNGGIIYSNNPLKISELDNNILKNENNLKTYGMILKDMYSKTNYNTNHVYLELFKCSEEMIDKETNVKEISDFTKFLISCESINNLVNKRKENCERLMSGLEKLGIYAIRKFSPDECPLVLPLRVKGRDEFRKYLMNNKIYCATHWPFDDFLSSQRINAENNAKTLISIPIDQRYGSTEIDYIIEVISSYRGELLF